MSQSTNATAIDIIRRSFSACFVASSMQILHHTVAKLLCVAKAYKYITYFSQFKIFYWNSAESWMSY